MRQTRQQQNLSNETLDEVITELEDEAARYLEIDMQERLGSEGLDLGRVEKDFTAYKVKGRKAYKKVSL